MDTLVQPLKPSDKKQLFMFQNKPKKVSKNEHPNIISSSKKDTS